MLRSVSTSAGSKGRPDMRDYPQESHPDLGLWPEQDRTEDLRTNKSAPEIQVLEHPAGTDPNPSTSK